MSAPMPQPHERHMTLITDRRAALAFVTEYAATALSACSTQRAARLANWIFGVVVLFVQIGALWLKTQHPCGFPAVATRAR